MPWQDFSSNSDLDWSGTVDEIDAQLYAKYELTAEQVAYIEQNIRSME